MVAYSMGRLDSSDQMRDQADRCAEEEAEVTKVDGAAADAEERHTPKRSFRVRCGDCQ
jgi:hypothetical protein